MGGLTSVKVSDIMSKNILLVSPNSSLKEVAEMMMERNVGSAVVVDESRKCLGIITERDFLKLFKDGVDPLKPVKEYMRVNPIRITEDKSVNEARNIMITHKIRHLPVVDNNNNIVGILSVRDIFERIETII
ncbi:MAG: CBS domain-containing protein [Aigarchaeota archaeon]|nr:CBS domain-containing protein [Aigarchaeota archaeon]MCX8192978.1 CBS domain-containing protein [Nitrososphaeria archaeon]MDW7986286.1 CBS domain-containing protein [Nitrososphaerota archaeon]